MAASRKRMLVQAGALLALLTYWLLELHHLAVVPRAYEDEAWIASTSWKLATQGVFGTDIQGGYLGVRQHAFGFMPLYPLLQSLVFRLGGVGLWQARLTSVLLGLLVLTLTFALGRRLLGASVGLLAVGGLLLTRTAGLTLYRPSGILLVDLARLARYDIAVPVFGLAACLALTRVRPLGRWRAVAWAALAGALGGLAGLAHIYGWFWLVALGAALVYHGATRRAWRWTAAVLAAFATGAGLVSLPYHLFVLSNWNDWVGQLTQYTNLLAQPHVAWYLTNLLTEPLRYGPGLDAADWRTWLRPGLWLVAAVGPLAAVALVLRARRSLAAAALAWSLALLPALMAVLITSKVANYLLLFLPLLALAVAWGLVSVWRYARLKRWAWLQGLLLLVCAAVAVEGLAHWARLDQSAAVTTPYDQYVTALRTRVEAAAPAPFPSVLGLHTYWFGFTDLPFTTWYYPLSAATTPVSGVTLPLTVTLAQIAPDVVLVDARTAAVLAAPAGPASMGGQINAWLAAEYVPAGVVDDAIYGRTDVYRRRAASDGLP